ncbi:MAG: FAD binding domain-containing protein [Pseudomonadota bacterium]
MMRDPAFFKPTTLEDALRLLREHQGALLIAGGQHLVPRLDEYAEKTPALINIEGLQDLRGVSRAASRLRIGAAETHGAISRDAVVKDAIPALAELAGDIGDLQVRNRGTIGGAVMSGVLNSDYRAALLALDAQLITAGATIDADKIDARPDLPSGDILVAIDFAIPARAEFIKHVHPAAGYADLAIMLAQHADGGLRLALIGEGRRPERLHRVEDALAKNKADRSAAIRALDDAVAGDASLELSDYHAHLLRRDIVALAQRMLGLDLTS